MSIWSDHDIETKILDILGDVRTVNEAHHFGRPYMSAYQLAIAFQRRHAELVTALGWQIGGAGTGQHNSLAQYLAKQLADRIRDNPQHSVEGAFLSNVSVRVLSYIDDAGNEVRSSVSDSGFDLSLFRLRNPTNLDG